MKGGWEVRTFYEFIGELIALLVFLALLVGLAIISGEIPAPALVERWF